MDTLPSLSVFFPVYNDAKILPYLIAQTYMVIPRLTSDYEVIIVNDGSTDDTEDVSRELQLHYKNLRIVTHESNKGYGGALITGFKSATKEWVLYTDGDCQYDPKDIKKLVRKITPDIDVVNGYKLNRGDGLRRKLIGNIYNHALHMAYKIPIRDVDCDFRIIRRSMLSNFTLTSSSGTICVELILKLMKSHARFSEVGVRHYPRPIGKSHFLNLRNVVKTAAENISFYLLYTSL